MSQCEGLKKDGTRCRTNAQHGNKFCVFHDPEKAADGVRARRAGGLARSRPATVLPLDTPDHPLRNLNDIASLMGNTINQVLRGQLDPRIATGIGYLTGILQNTLQKTGIEERVSKIEEVLDLSDPAKKEV